MSHSIHTVTHQSLGTFHVTTIPTVVNAEGNDFLKGYTEYPGSASVEYFVIGT